MKRSRFLSCCHAIVFAIALAGLSCAQALAQTEAVLRVGMSGNTEYHNFWPAAESPDHAIDGVGQKYLNFTRENGGFIVEPTIGSSVAQSITVWTANDAEARDPASFRLFGSSANIDIFALPGIDIPLSMFSEIASGSFSLPSSRNPGGSAALMASNSQTINFENSNAYTTYAVIFPTVKNGGGANSMQIAEVSLNESTLPIFSPGDAILGVELLPPQGDPVGPQPAPTQGNWSVREWRPYIAVNGTAGADAVIADPQWQFDTFVTDGMVPMINLADIGGGAGGGYSLVLPKQPFVGDTAFLENDIVMRAIAKVIIPADGQYTFGIDGDDGTRLTLQGANFTQQGGGGTAAGQVIEFPTNTGNAFTLGATFLTAGEHDIEVIWQERGGGAFVEIFAATGVKNATAGITPSALIQQGFSPVGLQETVQIAKGSLPTTVGDWDVRWVQTVPSRPLNNLSDAAAAIALSNSDPNVVFAIDVSDTVNNYNDSNNSPNNNTGGGRFLPDNPFPGEDPGADDNDFATMATVIVSIAEENDYIFGFGSDDGASLTLEGANFTILNPGGVRAVTNNGQTMEFNANTGNSDTFGWTRLMPGEYALTFLTWERGGGAWAEVYTGVGSNLASFLTTARLLGSPAETFDLSYLPGLQLGGEAPPPMGIDGDYNGNGTVEQADLDLVLLNWGASFETLPATWVHQRPSMGIVAQAQLDKVLLHWGNTAALAQSASIPEPSAVLLLAVASGLALHATRRR